MRESKAALISVHPQYVRQILAGTKRVEFRRVWASQPITDLVLYSTSPEMKIVAVLEIKEVIEAGIAGLWELAKEYGGGLTRHALRGYFTGKPRGYGLIINKVHMLDCPMPMAEVLPGVRPPQSYAYLSADQLLNVKERIKGTT